MEESAGAGSHDGKDRKFEEKMRGWDAILPAYWEGIKWMI